MKIHNTEVEFTRFWKKEDKIILIKKLKDILPLLPSINSLKIGLITHGDANGICLKGDYFNNPEAINYIRLKIDATHHTVAHEITHTIFDEKFIDLFALSCIKDNFKTHYLKLPNNIDKNFVINLRNQAINELIKNNKNPVDFFEQKLKEKNK